MLANGRAELLSRVVSDDPLLSRLHVYLCPRSDSVLLSSEVGRRWVLLAINASLSEISIQLYQGRLLWKNKVPFRAGNIRR